MRGLQVYRLSRVSCFVCRVVCVWEKGLAEKLTVDENLFRSGIFLLGLSPTLLLTRGVPCGFRIFLLTWLVSIGSLVGP